MTRVGGVRPSSEAFWQLEAIEWGHIVDVATTAPHVETIGVGVMNGGCADAGFGDVGRGRIECALLSRGLGRHPTASVGDGGAVGWAGVGDDDAYERPVDGHVTSSAGCIGGNCHQTSN